MAQVEGGPLTWSRDTDDDGYRTYKITFLVSALVTESIVDVGEATGLPTPGSVFDISGFSGTDSWVWCRPEQSIRIAQQKDGDPATYYEVECTFSNKWEGGKSRRCNDAQITDPCLEPMRVSGNFTSQQREARYTPEGTAIVTSANEPITGALATFDVGLASVHIEQNVYDLGLATIASLMNTVNAYTLWGVPPRCIKLSGVTWERKIYGACSYFYTRALDFLIDMFTQNKEGVLVGFDREIYDSGSMALKGQWLTDKDNPLFGYYLLTSDVYETTTENITTLSQLNFAAYRDMNDQPARVFLDGKGRPANALLAYETEDNFQVVLGAADGEASASIRYYRGSDFLVLGVPTSL